MSIVCKHVGKNTGEHLRSGSTVASFAESILDNMWVICNKTSGASKKDSPKDEGDNNSPSSGDVVEACPENL